MIDDATPDEELVRRWQAGKEREAIFEALERRYSAELARSFSRMDFDEGTCEDLIQETLLHAYRGLDRFGSRSSFRTWLHQIARNAGLKRLRRRRTRKRKGTEVPIDDLLGDEPGHGGTHPRLVADDGEDALERLASEDQRRRVRAAIDELPPTDRAMLFLRIWQERSVRDTARLLNKPVGTVKSGLSRIRATLGKKLGPQFPDLPP